MTIFKNFRVKLCAAVAIFLYGSTAVFSTELATLADLRALVEAEGFDNSSTLFVFDNDDTLTRMPCDIHAQTTSNCQYIGGPAWFAWQENLLTAAEKKQASAAAKAACKKYCVAKDFDELIEISNYLFAASRMQFSEVALIDTLTILADFGAPLMVLTARGDSAMSATEMQFGNLPLPLAPGQTLLDLFIKNAPQFVAPEFSSTGIVERASLSSPFTNCTKTQERPASYRNGVFYAAGQNKGDMLLCFLAQYATSIEGKANPIKNIVFLDDTEKNVINVHNAFALQKTYGALAIHYTYLQPHKHAFTNPTTGQKFQDAATSRWSTLNTALTSALLEPSVKAD